MRRLLFGLVLSSFANLLLAADAPEIPPAIVSHVQVLSEKVEDVSSLDAWKRSFITDGMSDKEKALAVWKSVVMFRHQDNPPREFMQNEETPIDPIKLFNVYGYCMCNGASGAICALARHAGLRARGWAIQNHSVPEVYFDEKWHLLDASLIVYFPQPDGGIAGVEEISAAVDGWYAKNPAYKGNNDKLAQFMRNGGWKNGPELLSHTSAYDNNGWLPAATHGWYSTMQEYENGAKHFLFEYGCAAGYQVNVQLRPGEKLTRNWSNSELHVNALENGPLGCLNKTVGTEDLRYMPAFGDHAPGRVGNGVHEWRPLQARDLRVALSSKNVRVGADFRTNQPVLGLRENNDPGEVIYRLPSSYVYLGGVLRFDNLHAQRKVRVELSRNNGRDWTEIGGAGDAEIVAIDLKPYIYRLYDYQIRFTLDPMASIQNIVFRHDVQHSQRALPLLSEGVNTVSFNSGPQEGTITVEGALDPNRKAKTVTLAEFAPVFDNLSGTPYFMTAGTGSLTLPVETPGDLTRLRVGLHYRARDKNDGWTIEASFDGGKTFTPFGDAPGPFAGNSLTFATESVPPKSRSVLVRLSGRQRNTTGILDLRIDADYREPHGGFRPVQVTYVWTENGVEKTDVHIAKSPKDTYTIQCGPKPVMKSYTVELTD
jgi:hypothetical protein